MTQKVSNTAVKKFKFLPTVQVSTKDKMHFFLHLLNSFGPNQTNQNIQGTMSTITKDFLDFFLNEKFKKSI